MSRNICDCCWRLGNTYPFRDDTVCSKCLINLKKWVKSKNEEYETIL